MSLGDTFTLPYGASSIVLNRVDTSKPYSASYYLLDNTNGKEFWVHVRHTQTKSGMWRHNVEASEKIFATETVPEAFTRTYFIIERMLSDENVEITDGLADWLIASSNANITSLFGLNA